MEYLLQEAVRPAGMAAHRGRLYAGVHRGYEKHLDYLRPGAGAGVHHRDCGGCDARSRAPAGSTGLPRCTWKIIRNTPLLVQLIIFYFGLGPLFQNSQTIPLVLGLGVFTGAYVAEIVRGGIQSAGQRADGGLVIGRDDLYAGDAADHPAAGDTENSTVAGRAVFYLDDQGFVAGSVFGYPELTHAANRVTAATFRALVPSIFVAGCYFVICYSISLVIQYVERRTARSGQV